MHLPHCGSRYSHDFILHPLLVRIAHTEAYICLGLHMSNTAADAISGSRSGGQSAQNHMGPVKAGRTS